ncbi:virion core protein, T7 gp14 family [Microvirga sp. G4-2]|uniref:virion core protein, T7 gp14 family n=1 Tax=Microvirga sp. G4-2 TaxID=3434467 RepID=UPI0040446483
MCVDPVSLGMMASVASAAVGAVGAIQQGNATAAANKYQAAVNENNAILAQRNADDARKRGEVAEEEHRRKVAQLQGRQSAVMAANGLDLTSGSPLDILADTAQMGELDALTIRNNAEREAKGHQAQGMNFRAEAELNRASAKSAKTAGMIGAVGSVVSGIGGVADKWYRMGSSVGKIG